MNDDPLTHECAQRAGLGTYAKMHKPAPGPWRFTPATGVDPNYPPEYIEETQQDVYEWAWEAFQTTEWSQAVSTRDDQAMPSNPFGPNSDPTPEQLATTYLAGFR